MGAGDDARAFWARGGEGRFMLREIGRGMAWGVPVLAAFGIAWGLLPHFTG